MKKSISLLIIIISVSTVASGLLQVIAPAFVLKFIGAAISPISTQLFATIGMFMAIFGGMMLHTLYSVSRNPVAILWSAFQKFGAAIAVGFGICQGIFYPVAGAVALFDLLSGSLFIFYYCIQEKR